MSDNWIKWLDIFISKQVKISQGEFSFIKYLQLNVNLQEFKIFEPGYVKYDSLVDWQIISFT